MPHFSCIQVRTAQLVPMPYCHIACYLRTVYWGRLHSVWVPAATADPTICRHRQKADTVKEMAKRYPMYRFTNVSTSASSHQIVWQITTMHAMACAPCWPQQAPLSCLIQTWSLPYLCPRLKPTNVMNGGPLIRATGIVQWWWQVHVMWCEYWNPEFLTLANGVMASEPAGLMMAHTIWIARSKG